MNCRWMMALTAAGLAAMWPIARAEPPTSAPASQPASEVAAPVFAVLDYFQQNCAGCHGPYGKYYLPNLGDRHAGEQLRAILKEMADGPAQAPLETSQLDQLVKYHESLAAGEPYVAVTDREGSTLRGEVSPGNQVIIEVGDIRIEAEVTGHTWEADFPGDVDAGEINVIVKVDSEKQ